MQRRDFLSHTILAASSAIALSPRTLMAAVPTNTSALDEFILKTMKETHVPGLAACIVDREDLLWSNSYGWSDMENRIPMNLDRIQNIGSISKTFTATAVMQQVELGLLDLDRNIDDYLGFSIRNPNHPDVPITTRQLMVHTSSLRDGSAYVNHYACGDPRISLRKWIEGFFVRGGAFYNAKENFNPWAPNSTWQYCNLAYGVLGVIVESISGIPFDTYCRRNIFLPLGMKSTSWMLSDLDLSRHSIPYCWVEDGVVRGASWGGVKLGVVNMDGLTHDEKLEDGFHINCFYNHPNYPDGFLRTTVSDLSRYLRAYLNAGLFEGARILRSETVDLMFTPQKLPLEEKGKRTYGLTWYALQEFNNHPMWGHGGGDPGIGTGILCLRDDGVGAIVFTNTEMSGAPQPILEKLAETALILAG